MLDARFSQLYFGPSLNTLQRGLPAIAGLLVSQSTRLTDGQMDGQNSHR